MKKILVLCAALAVFALVWAAGHDILKGEANAWQEWLVVLAGLGLAIFALLLQIKNFKTGDQV